MPDPLEYERRPITAVFVDLVRSTSAVEERDPEDVRGRLDPYFRLVRGELERFGGRVEKFIGDAVVGVFGAPVARGDDAERAVRAAFAVLAAIDRLNGEDASRGLSVQIGVNTGEAVVALGADEAEPIAWGDVVNTASRLQSAAPVGGILVGSETWRLTRRTIEYVKQAPVQAKGKARRVAVWRPLRVAPSEPVAPRPLVGRERDLAALEQLWRRVTTEGHAAYALVVGPAGIGKSRLVAELRTVTEGTAVGGRCLPYGEGMTYQPVIEMLRQLAGIGVAKPGAGVATRVDTLVGRLVSVDRDELSTIGAALANLLGTEASPQGTRASGEISQAELHWGLRRLLELSARERPLLVVFDDLHWAEPALLELIRFIADGSAAPLMLVGTARQEVGAAGAELQLELGPLSAEESGELLRGVLGRAPAELLERADGNPLFLEELAGIAGVTGESDEALPTTLKALLGARLDALGRADRRVAQYASVCGSVFWPGAVAELTQEQQIDASLAELEHREFIRRHADSTITGQAEWAFKHVLVRDVAYGRLPKALRGRLHERFARWIAAVGTAEENLEVRAWHFEQACRLARDAPPVDEAIDALTAAGERAEQREGIEEADRFYGRALALLEPDDLRVLGLRLRRARLLAMLANLDGAVAALGPIAEEAGEHGLEQVRAHALVALANVELKLGLPEPARARLSEATAYAERVADVALAARAAFELAWIHSWFDGDLDGACQLLRAAMRLADQASDRALAVAARHRLGTTLFNAARLAEAEAVLQQAAVLADALSSLRDKARTAVLLAAVSYYRYGVRDAEQQLFGCTEWLVRTGDVYLRIQSLRGLAKCALERNEPELAERHLSEALPLALGAGGWLAVEIYRYLIEALLQQGRLDDAVTLLGLAREAVPKEDPYARAILLLAEALTTAEARADEIGLRQGFADAVDALEALGLPLDAAEAQLVFARTLRQFDPGSAADQLAVAKHAFARIGADALVTRIDEELAYISA